MKVWITKYALTKGIEEAEGELRQTDGRVYVCVQNDNRYGMDYYFGKDWHLTQVEAIARAEEMRIKKLQHLDAQMKKLSALRFY